MDVTQGMPDGAALSSLNGDWVLARDTVTGRFARRFGFALPTGGLADGIRWRPNTGLTLSFPTFDYNARASGAPESATLANSGSDGVQVTFPVPRTLLRVKISGAQAGDVIEAHRVDGDVITEDAFAHASHGSTGATLNATDRQLVLRQTRGGTGLPLRTTNVEEVVVRSAAANVRVGVVLPALSAEVLYLGPAAGAVLTNPVTASNIGPALAMLLQGACDRLTDSLAGNALPASVAMTLVIESDPPTRAHISGFALRYRLYRRRFDDLAPKRVFEFPGESLTTRQLTIGVPRSATLWSATLRMMGPFKEQGDEEPDNGGGSTVPPPIPLAEASDLGVELRAGESAAARVMLAQAALVQGATIELVALSEASTGRVRLHQDAAGQPGEVLGEASFAAMSAGTRRVVRVDFDHASVVSAGPVWAAAQCDNGALLWLTNVPSDATAGSSVLRRAAGDVVWTAVSAASDRGAVASFVTASGADGSDLLAGHPAFHGVRLYLGGVRLRGRLPVAGSAGDKETRFSVAPAVQPLAQSGTAGTLAAVSLSLVSSEPGRVTVYPPEFEFEP
jgi:hypothetical protein